MMKALKRLSAAALLLTMNVAIVLLIVTQVPINSAGAGTGSECLPGDTNGDGVVSILDPLYNLVFLFQEGPEPVACASGPSKSDCCWPPHPEDIVTIDLLDLADTEIGGEDTLVLYEVPDDKWLVVTKFGIAQEFTDPALDCEPAERVLETNLVQYDGTDSEIRFSGGGRNVYSYSTGSALGLRFAPGTSVMLDSPVTNTPACDYDLFLTAFHLTGYLVDE